MMLPAPSLLVASASACAKHGNAKTAESTTPRATVPFSLDQAEACQKLADFNLVIFTIGVDPKEKDVLARAIGDTLPGAINANPSQTDTLMSMAVSGLQKLSKPVPSTLRSPRIPAHEAKLQLAEHGTRTCTPKSDGE